MRSHAAQIRKAKKLSKEKKRSGKRRTTKCGGKMLQELEPKDADADAVTDVEMETETAEASSGTSIIPVYSNMQNTKSIPGIADIVVQEAVMLAINIMDTEEEEEEDEDEEEQEEKDAESNGGKTSSCRCGCNCNQNKGRHLEFLDLVVMYKF